MTGGSAALARDEELAALKRPFRLGALACLAAIIAIGGVVAAFGTPADRPAGIAERWLVAVGDTTREGIEADALDRARDHGDPSLAAPLVPPAAAVDGERAFEDIQVGRDADPSSDGALIPFRVTPYEGEEVDGEVTLSHATGTWQVVAVTPVPEVTIDRPARAPLGFWLGAVALGLLVTLGCAAAVRAATPTDPVGLARP